MAATEPTRDPAALATVSGPSITVLYIEDNLTNVRLLEQVMRLRPNVDLMVAMQGRIGLQMALDHRPGIILLDLHLPDMSGNEVLRSLRADERTAAHTGCHPQCRCNVRSARQYRSGRCNGLSQQTVRYRQTPATHR